MARAFRCKRFSKPFAHPLDKKAFARILALPLYVGIWLVSLVNGFLLRMHQRRQARPDTKGTEPLMDGRDKNGAQKVCCPSGTDFGASYFFILDVVVADLQHSLKIYPENPPNPLLSRPPLLMRNIAIEVSWSY